MTDTDPAPAAPDTELATATGDPGVEAAAEPSGDVASDVAAAAPAEEVTEVLTGRRLGRYRVGEVLHDGPMSTLYRAVDTRLDRPVALKVISPLLASDEEFRARFIDEARNTSAIDHPHVVPVYDHDEIDEHLYLAMRYVEGPNLADLIAGHPLPLARVLAVGAQIAQALDAVHSHGLVHLDVKPANILITAAHQAHSPAVGGGPRGEHAYLADFGLTRRGAAPASTGAGHFLGSPAYAAPEHLRGQPVTAATDLYSLGCVLHTALTGRAPYLGGVDEVIAAHLAGHPPAAGGRRAAHQPTPEPGLVLGAATDALLARALAPDPGERPGSAGELIAQLRTALVRDAQPAHPPPRPTPRRAPGPSVPRPTGPLPPRPPRAPATPATGARTAGSPRSQVAGRRTTEPVAPLATDPFTGRAPRARFGGHSPQAVIAVAIAVFAVLLALGLAIFLP